MAEIAPPSTVNVFDAVLLDAGGVLILPEHDVMRAALTPFGVRPTDAQLTRAHYAGMAARDVAPERPGEAYQRAYAAACGVPEERLAEAAAALSQAGAEWVSATDGARGYLAELAELGVALAVVSNAVGTVEWQLGVAGVCQVGEGGGVPVATVIDSHLVGIRKPDPEIFRLGLTAVGVPADRALMVGDYAYADVQGAERAGIRAVHLDPYGDCTSAHAGPHVTSLADVVALVRSSRSRH